MTLIERCDNLENGFVIVILALYQSTIATLFFTLTLFRGYDEQAQLVTLVVHILTGIVFSAVINFAQRRQSGNRY